MNYILVYSLSLLLYQGLATAEEHNLRHYLSLLSKPINRLDLTQNTARNARHGSHGNPVTA